MKRAVAILFVLSLAFCIDANAAWWGSGDEAQTCKKVALIVQNHCPGELALPMEAFADVVAAHLSEQGLRVINAHNAIGTKQNALPYGEIMPESSAKELARMIGADGFVTASVLAFSGETIGLPEPVAYRIKAKIAISLADTATGAIVCGVVEPNCGKNVTVEQGKADGDLLFEEVLMAAAEKCTKKFLKKYESVEWKVERGNYVDVKFEGNMKGALIKVDGVAVGTIPANGKVSEGVHNLSVEYPFCIPYSTMASFSSGQTFDAELQLNAEGIVRYKDMENFKEELDRRYKSGETEDYVRRKMADGEADAMRIKAAAEADAIKLKAEKKSVEDEMGTWQQMKNLFLK